MKTITIYYWHGAPLPGIKYRQGDEKPYSARTLSGIIKHVLNKNCGIMIKKSASDCIIQIDDNGFRQR